MKYNFYSMSLFEPHDILVENISPAYLGALLRLHREDKFNGIFHIKGSNTETVLFLFNGNVKLAYGLEGNSWYPFSAAEKDAFLQRAEGDVRILRFRPSTLRLIRIYLENEGNACLSVQDHPTEHLAEWLGNTFRQCGQGVACIKGTKWRGLILTYPDEHTTTDAVAWSKDASHYGQMALNLLRHLQEPQCSLSYFCIHTASEAWQEYLITTATQKLTSMLLMRFRDLAGQIMLLHLSEEMSKVCQRQDWEFIFQEGTFFHEHFFPSVKEAQRVHLNLVRTLISKMGLILGEALCWQMFQEMKQRLPDEEREALAFISPETQSYPSMEIA